MDLTRVISLITCGDPALLLLGGVYSPSDDLGVVDRRVWELEWNSTSQGYYWAGQLEPPMGGFHSLLLPTLQAGSSPPNPW